MKKTFFLLSILISVIAYGQKPPCAFGELLRKDLTDHPLMREQLDRAELKISEARSTSRTAAFPTPGSIRIPVVFYIVHDGTTATNVTDLQVTNQLATLNTAFATSGVKFCLATRAASGTSLPMITTSDPQTQTTPGIIHYQNATLMNHQTSNPASLTGIASSLITGERYLRIWVVNSIDGGLPGILGYAGFPFGSFNGIVMRNNAFGVRPGNIPEYNEGDVLLHEVGHYLGLYHTFEAGCTSPTGNQLLDGDHVADTPKVAEPNYSCVTGINTCVDSPEANDLIQNFMDYGNNLCASSFTNGQYQRMLDMINIYKTQLVSLQNTVYTGTCDYQTLTTAEFTANKYTSCVGAGGTIAFTAPNVATYQYSWDFGDGSSATTYNPSHNYASVTGSPYTVTLTINNTATGNIATFSDKVYVINCTAVANTEKNWYLARSHSLNFSTGLATFDSQIPNYYNAVSTAVQSNATGNLLFYTNGDYVWRNDNTQINPVSLGIPTSVPTNQVLIVPNPGNANQYYVFRNTINIDAITGLDNNSGFKLSLVNVAGTTASMVLADTNKPITQTATYGMSAANGYMTNPLNGAVVGGSSLSAVKKCDGYWILTTLMKSNTSYSIVVFSLTASGLTFKNEYPIPFIGGFNLQYRIKMSPNGNKMYFYTGSIDSKLFDFNKADGIINTPVALTNNACYGAAFSPDSKILYVTQRDFGSRIYQYNINTPNVNGSKKEVARLADDRQAGMVQQGPDNKLYISIQGSNELGVIHNPNNLSALQNDNVCNFSPHGPQRFYTNSGNIIGTLPNMIDAKLESAYFPINNANTVSAYKVGCNRYKFFPNYYNSNCAMVYHWVITNTTTGAPAFTTYDINPVYDFTTTGIYTIVLKNSINTTMGTAYVSITNFVAPPIQGSTTACVSAGNNSVTNNSIVLAAGQSVVWSVSSGGIITGANDQASVNIRWTSLTTAGTITATVTDSSGCIAYSTKQITSYCPCNCLPTLTFTQSGGMDDYCPVVIGNTSTNQICRNLNMRHTWSLPLEEDPLVTYGYNGVNNCSDGTFFVVTDILDANGAVLCTIKHNQIGIVSDSRSTNPTNNGAIRVDNEVKINPNPSKGIFNIRIEQFSGKVSIKIYDMNAKLVFEANEEDFNIEKEIDLSRFRTGLYLLKVTGENLNYSQKLIKN